MVAENRLRPAVLDSRADPFDDGGAILATITQIPDEDEASALGMTAVWLVAQMKEQLAQRLNLTMYIADDVDRSIHQGLHELTVIHVLPLLFGFGVADLYIGITLERRQYYRGEVPP